MHFLGSLCRMEATVKKIGTKQFGFLKNPEGGDDIFFHLGGQRVQNGQKRSLPAKGQKVIILSLVGPRPDQRYAQARHWKLP